MTLLLLFILLLINAVLVMTEMALATSRRARLQARADKGDRGAIAAIRLIDQPTRYLSTVQIGITVTSIFLGMFGEASISGDLAKWLERYPALVKHAHWMALTITLLTLTLATLVIAELVPKRLAQINPEGTSRLLARPMMWVSGACAPLVAVLSWMTDVIIRMLPIRPGNPGESTEDEVKALIASGTESGVFHKQERQMVERVFSLSDQRVKALMVPRTDIDYLLADDTIQRVRVVVATSSHSHFPVCQTGLDDLVGVVHVKDLVKAGLISDEINLKALSRPPLFVPESALAIKVLEQLRARGMHIAFVLDEYGVMVGLVTMADILEGVVGEMTSAAGDSQDPMVVRRDDGSYLLDGMLSVAELESLMGVEELPRHDQGDFDTLGGFVMTYLGRVPHTGDSFEFGRFRFEVVDMDRTRVDKILLSFQPGDTTRDSGPAI